MKTKTKTLIKKAIIFSFALFVLSIANISQSLAQNPDVVSQLRFVDVRDRLKNTDHSLDFVIVRWSEWGRKKKECKGMGICNAEWFPEVQEVSSETGGGSIVEFDKASGSYYFDILLAENPPAVIALADITLEIDEDILLETKSVIGKNLIIQEGQYSLNASLGKFGGYRVRMN